MTIHDDLLNTTKADERIKDGTERLRIYCDLYKAGIITQDQANSMTIQFLSPTVFFGKTKDTLAYNTKAMDEVLGYGAIK